MKKVFKLKDLVKYIVFIGVVYALFKLIPSQPFNQRDLILIVAVISFGFIFIDCYSSTEGFANMEQPKTAAVPENQSKNMKQENLLDDNDDDDTDADDNNADNNDDNNDNNDDNNDDNNQETKPKMKKKKKSTQKKLSYDDMRKQYYNKYQESDDNTNQRGQNMENNSELNNYQNVLNKTNSESNNQLKSILTDKSEKNRFQDSKRVNASNDNQNVAGCGVEIEKLKREVSKHIGNLESKIKSLENQPVNENMEKYKNYLMKDLLELGVMDQIDIDNLNAKIENRLMNIEEAISKLEKLKITSRPKNKLNRAIRESEYNELPKDFYNPLGDPELNKWDTAFHMLNTNKWQVPMPRPPVCINTSPCKVCPEVTESQSNGSNPLSLKDWEYSRKVMNLVVNKDWANDQMDVNAAIPLNVMSKEEIKRQEYNYQEPKMHPPTKTGGLIPPNSNMEDNSSLSVNNVNSKIKSNPGMTRGEQIPRMQNYSEMNSMESSNDMASMESSDEMPSMPSMPPMPPMPPVQEVQSFRNIDKNSNYVKKHRARFE